MKTLLTTILITALVAGCATGKKVRNMPSDAGVERTYKADFEKTQQAGRDAMSEGGFTIRDASKDDKAMGEGLWHLQGSQGLKANTVGRYARLRIQKREKDVSIRVLIVSKVDSTDAALGDTAIANALHEGIARRLKKK